MPTKRKPNLTRKPAAKAASKPTRKPAAKAAETGKPAKADKPERVRHEIASTYAGASQPYAKTRQADRTPIRARVSGTFSPRSQAIIADLAAKYGNKPFQRGDLGDSLNRPLFWECVEHVSGETWVGDNGETYYSPDSVFKIANPKSPLAPGHAKASKLR